MWNNQIKNPFSDITQAQYDTIKTVVEEQKKRYIDICPCCGQANMYSENGKTLPLQSMLADVYICSNCWEKERSGNQLIKFLADTPDVPEIIYYSVYKEILLGSFRPLSQWAVFDKNTLDYILEGDHEHRTKRRLNLSQRCN